MLLALPYILPLLKSINFLFKFRQVGSVFVFMSNMIAIVKIC
jgi:hypothetical protein